MEWTLERALALAPDAQSVKAGLSQASLRFWSALGQRDGVVWGRCQGSARYDVQCDLNEPPAYKCSCPSHKFPCKHAIALMVLLAREPDSLTPAEPPDWVAVWLASRAERATKAAVRAETRAATPPGTVADPDAQAKRVARRDERVADGMAELDAWLADQMRVGLAGVATAGVGPWERVAGRLVDAQAGGLARQVRALYGEVNAGPDWQDRVLERFGMLALFGRAWQLGDALPPDLAADLRGLIGKAAAQQEVLLLPALRDTWQVLCRVVTAEDGGLTMQRTWLRGDTVGGSALVLDFAFGSAPLDVSLIPGQRIDAELVYFPGAVPQRALVKARHAAPVAAPPTPWHADFAAVFDDYATALARNPWQERLLVGLAAARFAPPAAGTTAAAARWQVHDATGHTLSLAGSDAAAWQALALTGGQPCGLIAEWDGRALTPLSLIHANRLWTL